MKKKAQFKPSPASLSPHEQTIAMLDYMVRTLGFIREEVVRTGDVPPVWVLERLQIAASGIGTAASFLKLKQDRKKET